MDDIVKSPSHYTNGAPVLEPMDLTMFLPHPIASAFEYCFRAGKKKDVPKEVDLAKAEFWLDQFLSRLINEPGVFHLPELNPCAVAMLHKFAKTEPCAKVILETWKKVSTKEYGDTDIQWSLIAAAFLRQVRQQMGKEVDAEK